MSIARDAFTNDYEAEKITGRTLGRGETLYWSGAARMMVEKTRTVSTQRAGRPMME